MRPVYDTPLEFHSYSPLNSTVSPLRNEFIRGTKSMLCAINNVCPVESFKINFLCLLPSVSSARLRTTIPEPVTWPL